MEKRWQMFFYNLLVAQGIPQFPQRNFTGKKKKKENTIPNNYLPILFLSFG